MRKTQKQRVVTGLAETLQAHTNLVLTDYRGLTVKDMAALRRSLAGVGGRMQVVKNRLFLRALGEDPRAALSQLLTGPVAVAFCGEEAVPVVKELVQFARGHPQLQLKGGWLDSQLLTAAQLAEVAALPPRPELLGRLVGALSGPLSQLVGVLQAVPRDLVFTLKALAEKRAEAGA
jgi:large subunit ribosomal protein L10